MLNVHRQGEGGRTGGVGIWGVDKGAVFGKVWPTPLNDIPGGFPLGSSATPGGIATSWRTESQSDWLIDGIGDSCSTAGY